MTEYYNSDRSLVCAYLPQLKILTKDTKAQLPWGSGACIRLLPKWPYENSAVDVSDDVGREIVIKTRVGDDILHEAINANSVTVEEFATSKNLVIRNTTMPHCNIQKFAWTSPDERACIHIVKWYSVIIYGALIGNWIYWTLTDHNYQ
jgi:hypothetical protein